MSPNIFGQIFFLHMYTFSISIVLDGLSFFQYLILKCFMLFARKLLTADFRLDANCRNA